MNLLTADSSVEGGRVVLALDSTSFSQKDALVTRIPFVMPREQMYYWTSEWQEGEREAMREYEAGQAVRFDSDDPEDVLRWLHEPEEDEAE